jgi:hypothetical protein
LAGWARSLLLSVSQLKQCDRLRQRMRSFRIYKLLIRFVDELDETERLKKQQNMAGKNVFCNSEMIMTRQIISIIDFTWHKKLS